MKLNNKGFSFIEILAAVLILSILLVLGINEYSKHYVQSVNKAYDMMAKSVESATENYLMDHPTATTVTLEKLVEGQYLEETFDPGKEGNICQGKVNITKIKDIISNKLDINYYTISLCCEGYNYTYKPQEGKKYEDEFCRAYPYDITRITDIQVLHVYPTTTTYSDTNPDVSNQLTEWMDSYGKGIIHVTPVSIGDFNSKFSQYIDENGKSKYDVIVFGFVDCYYSKDLVEASRDRVDAYLNNGGSAIFGHDTITQGCGNHRNFNSLAHHVSVEAKPNPQYHIQGTRAKIVKSGVFTEYPYNIGSLGSILNIPNTHTSGQIATGEIWLLLDGHEEAATSIYLSTFGNSALIQTGHTKGGATPDEQKIIANLIFYAKSKQYE